MEEGKEGREASTTSSPSPPPGPRETVRSRPGLAPLYSAATALLQAATCTRLKSGSEYVNVKGREVGGNITPWCRRAGSVGWAAD